MKDWYYIKVLIVGILIGVAVLVAFNIVASYLTQGKVTIVPRVEVEYRDKIVYASCPSPKPTALPVSEVKPAITAEPVTLVPVNIQPSMSVQPPVPQVTLPDIPVVPAPTVEVKIDL